VNCSYLEGENNAPRNAADAKRLIGLKVIYLRDTDIDRSGRGYFFPRTGVVCGTHGKELAIDDAYNFVGKIKELVILPTIMEQET